MPKDENPAEAPAETPIVEAAPEAPAENAPAEEAAPEAPAENTPAEPETPAENAPAEEAAPEAPAENAPAEPEAPAENKPAEEPAPAETPAVEATPAAPAVEAAPATPAAPKKKHTGLIAGIAAAAVVVGGGAGFAIYKNNPDVVAVEAITSLINAKQLSYTVESEMLPADEDAVEGIKSIKMIFAGLYDNNGEIKTEATATLSVDVEDLDDPIKVTVGSAMVKDYTAYIKLDDLKESFDAVKDILEDKEIELGDELEDFIDSTIKKIDGVWWKVGIDDILDVAEIKGSSAKQAKAVYNCITDAIDRESAKNSAYADLYKEHKFINFEKYDGGKDFSKKLGAGTVYAATIDGEEFAEYMNGALKEIDTDSIKSCLSEAGISNLDNAFEQFKKDPIEKSQFKDAFKNMPKLYVSVDGFFAHTLTGIYIPNTFEDSSADFTGDIVMKFTQGKGDFKSTLDTGSAKSISDLKDTIEEIVEEAQALKMKMNPYSYDYPDYDYDDDDDYDFDDDDYDLDDLYDDEELDSLLKSLED